jgi:hypothetical protein
MLALSGSYSYSHIVGGFIVIAIAYRVWKLFYDLYLHTLARIPGPKLAAVTYLYQTYFSLVGGSRFYIQIGKLHAKYGGWGEMRPNLGYLLTESRAYRADYSG